MNPAEDGPKRMVRGALVKVLTHHRTDRGMRLEEHAARCVRRREVHELVSTDQWDPRPGARIDRVGFLGFAELECGGVIDRGDLRLRPEARVTFVQGSQVPENKDGEAEAGPPPYG